MTTYQQIVTEQRQHLALCTKARELGIPVSLDDPRSPKTIRGLRNAILYVTR